MQLRQPTRRHKGRALHCTHDTCSVSGSWPEAHRTQAANRITVYNNGDGVPVEVHKEEGVYVPELIFGHLLTSSNYNDDEKKVRALLPHCPDHMRR